MLPARSPVFALAGLLGLASCAVGPNFHRPAAPQAASYTPTPLPAHTVAPGGMAGSAQYFDPGQAIPADWWTLFHSPQLNSLIAAAFAHNPTLAAAQDALLQARDTARAGQGAYLPSLSGSFTGERERISGASAAQTGSSTAAGRAGASISPFDLYNASVSVSYTLDLFGGVRRQVESLQAQAEYQRFLLEASYLSLTTNLVTAAVTEASLNAQIDATNQIIKIETGQLDILKKQVALGGVAQASVLSQQATLASAMATLPPLQSQLAQERNQIAAYVGALPADFHEADFKLADLHLPEHLPVSLPSALVEQRPDIQEYSALLHQASANVGVATANMLPQVTLSASYGQDALQIGKLFTPQSLIWSLVAGITQPIFEGGTLTFKRRAAIAALHQAGAQYQETVITAFQNVSDTLEALQYDALTVQAEQQAAAAAASSLHVAEAQYRLGGVPYTQVLSDQQTYQTALVNEAKAEATRYTDTAALFQALGGGWWQRDDVSQQVTHCCGILP